MMLPNPLSIGRALRWAPFLAFVTVYFSSGSSVAQEKQPREEPVVQIMENRRTEQSEHHRTLGLDPDGRFTRVKILGSGGRSGNLGGAFLHLTRQMGLEGWSLGGGNGRYTTGTALKWSGHTEQVSLTEGHYDALILSPYRIHGNETMVERERLDMRDCYRMALYGNPNLPVYMLHNMRIEYDFRRKTFQRRRMHNWYETDDSTQIPSSVAQALELARQDYGSSQALAVDLANDLTANIGSPSQSVQLVAAAAAEIELLRKVEADQMPGLNSLEDIYVRPIVKLGDGKKVPVSDYLFALVIHATVSGRSAMDWFNEASIADGASVELVGAAQESDVLLQRIAWEAVSQAARQRSTASPSRNNAKSLHPVLDKSTAMNAEMVSIKSDESLSSLMVEFDRDVPPGILLNPRHYRIIPDTEIISVVPAHSSREVLVRTKPMNSGGSYALKIKGAGSLEFSPKEYAWQFADRDRGTKASWAFFGSANGLLGFNAKGYGTLSRKELAQEPFLTEGNEFLALTIPRKGDFDFYIRIHALSKNGTLGIVTANDMEDLSKGGYCYIALTQQNRERFGGSAGFEVGYVDSDKPNSVADEINTRLRRNHPGGPRPVPLWRTWVRLSRRGEAFSAYAYTDDRYDDFFHGARVRDEDWDLLHTFKTMNSRPELRVGVFTAGGSPRFASETFSTCELAPDAFRSVD